MTWCKIRNLTLLATALACLWLSACSSSNKANQVLVSFTASLGSVMLPTQSQTITALVSGATDVSSAFDCSYTTTPNPTTATPSPKPSASADCSSANGAVGVLSNIQNTSTTAASTATFTAPQTFPDQTKLPNVTVTITATANADKKKIGKFTINFDSGIRIAIIPATATLATGETQLFLVKDLSGNIISPDQLTWGVTFEVTAKIDSVSCGTATNSCGSIDKTGLYTAPAAVPAASSATTPTQNAAGIVTVFAFSNVDNARIAQAAVTIVKAGDITFSGISPSVAPQGALQQDIFLAATNATSQLGVTLSGTGGNVTVDQSQIKVVFTAGSSSSSIGARVHLNSAQLATAGHFTVQVTTSNPSVNVTGGPFPLDIVPVRPTIVSSTPDNFQESSLGQTGGVPFVSDGGFFGPIGAPTVAASINGQALLANGSGSPTPTARRLTGFLPPPSGTAPNAGLFPLSIKYSISPIPPPGLLATTAYTNIAIVPDYGGSNAPTTLSPVTFPASSAPSAIALDPVLGYAVVALAGLNTSGSNTNTQNNVQFLNLAGGTPALATAASSGGNVATGVAVDDQLHVAAIVNYGSRTLSVLSIPAGTVLGTVDLSGVIPPPVPANPSFVEPFPYSVGIDPFSHRAVVAFASTNVGLIVNLDPAVTPSCLPFVAQSTYCPITYVTLNTGAAPQVAFEAGARLAYVTPGGAGFLSGVNLANPSGASVDIVSATRASNVVTITITTKKSLNLSPGNPGTVLISGLPQGSTNMTNFNGSFAVGAVLDSTHFQYSQADKDDTSTCAVTCLASSGVPFLTYTISPSITGIAINPITRQAVFADPNATSSQILYIDAQSQSVTSMTLFLNATGQVSTGSPELGAASVAFQPFSNTALSFNPKLNQLSFLDPSALQRLKILPTNQTAQTTVSFTPSGAASPITANLSGALAVDSANNLALAVNSGSDSISVFKLGTIKPVHIERVKTPAFDSSGTGISVPAQLTQAVKITSGVAPAPVSGVQIFGSGFTNLAQVRLDGVALPNCPGANCTVQSDHQVDVTIPVSIPDPNSPNGSGTMQILNGPRHFALDVVDTNGVGSNAVDFTVVEEVPLAGGTCTAPAPGGVAIDEVNNLAAVANTGCNTVSVIDINPTITVSNQVQPNPNLGHILGSIPTGGSPTAVAVLPRLTYTGQPANTSGVAVVTNNSANTVSVLDLVNLAPVNDSSGKAIAVSVGTAPSGVAIDQETNLAVIANTGSNTVSTIDLTPLTASPIGALTPATAAVDQSPIAVAIDPDRGSNGRGLAVVTALQLNGASAPFGVLDAVDIGGSTPFKQTSASVSGIQSTPTGIVFDPSVSPALFYATSTQANQITAFNPDTGQTQTIKVGINPNAIAFNFQTGTMLTVNSLSNSISVVDSQTFRTKATLGIGSTSQLVAAIRTVPNLAVIADQANNRVILFPLPK